METRLKNCTPGYSYHVCVFGQLKVRSGQEISASVNKLKWSVRLAGSFDSIGVRSTFATCRDVFFDEGPML
jgi:hypothetical protein